MMEFKCSYCDKYFTLPCNARRHERAIHGNSQYDCSICKKVFNRKDIYRRHMKTRHDAKKIQANTIDAATQTETHDKPMDATTKPEETSAAALTPVETDINIKSIVGVSVGDVTTKNGVIQKFRNIYDSETDGIYTLRLKEWVSMATTRTYSVPAKSIILDPKIFLDGLI